MMKFSIIILLLTAGRSLGLSVTHGTKLISTLVMHRHGDRTPFSHQMLLATDPDAVEAASAVYGYGQLTDVGKRRAFSMGETIRARYLELLSPQYNKSEIYIRSTDSTRTKMTVLVAMAAVYPAYSGSWSQHINWQPTPYTTVPVKYDFNLFNLNCPNFIRGYNELSMADFPRLDPYIDVLNDIAVITGSNLTSLGTKVALYDVFTSQESLGVPLGEKISAIMPELERAAGKDIDAKFGRDDYLALQGGPILNEFFTQADQLIAGIDTPRVRIHSAHDLTVYAFQSAAQVFPRQGFPKYTAIFGLELRQIEKTGEYVVLAVYQASAGSGWVYLKPSGCDTLCPYDTYKSLVIEHTIDEDTWRSKCGFTDDLEVSDLD